MDNKKLNSIIAICLICISGSIFFYFVLFKPSIDREMLDRSNESKLTSTTSSPLIVEKTIARDDGVEKNDDLKFDIDLNHLTYQLPSFTKKCIPEYKLYCTQSGECNKVKPGVFVLIDENGINDLMYRCDNKPCDQNAIKTAETGMYTYYEPIATNGFVVKYSSIDNSYYETVSLGLDMYISYGKCYSL